MNVKIILLTSCLVLAGFTGKASAQGGVLTLQTRFETEIGESVEARLRDAIHQGMVSVGTHEVLNEQATRDLLGDQAERLMVCSGDPACFGELAELTQASAALIFSISEVGEIYTFTVDCYQLPGGEGLYFSDSDCPLCTVDEASRELSALARMAMEAIPGGRVEEIPDGQVVLTAPGAEGTILSIRAEPQGAEIYLDDAFLSTGSAQVEVEPGTHHLRVALAGYEPLDQALETTADGPDMNIAVRLSSEERVVVTTRGGGWLGGVDTTAWGSVFAGTGIAALVVGAVLLAIDGDPSCTDDEPSNCPEVFDTFSGGVTLTVLGTSALTGGILLLLWDYLAGPPAAAPLDPADPAAGGGPEASLTYR